MTAGNDEGGRPLPERRGPRPQTTPTNPHMQLDQLPRGRVLASLANLLFSLPGVREEPSAISVPGARALWLEPNDARGPREAFLVGREFAHLHPAPEGSLHAALPPSLAADAIAQGWAEVHPVARLGLIPGNVVMLYAPRDEGEVSVVLDLVRAALAFARGEVRGDL
jgi:luciferase-like monooxygenase